MYVHLENVLVHLINAQDIAIFKSQKDYVRNKQKLLEYIYYAQLWQVLLIKFSYASFTCGHLTCDNTDHILYKKLKTMQAMLMAFITMNRSNSAILPLKQIL